MFRRYVLDRDVVRCADGCLLAGGFPPRLVRLSPAGAAALDRLLGATQEPGDEPLRDRLIDHGVLHPVAAEPGPGLSFVVPVRDGGERLPRLVTELRPWGPVLVVDDGSTDGSARRARDAGAATLANDRAPGPAGARNAGLAATTTALVAFVDADCRCPREWAGPLAGLLAEDPSLALAAPRVRSARGGGEIAAYERSRSPLDMGPDPGLAGPGRRIGFVPSAALVARRKVLIGLGGFDEGLRFGEDVDLVWRANAAGWTVRYAPEIEVEHQPRRSAGALARQRFQYGSSSAGLDRRHPGAVAPLVLDRGSTAIVTASAIGGVPAGVSAALLRMVLSARRRGGRDSALAIASLSVRAHLNFGRRLARALVREWLPATVVVCLLSRRSRRAALLALAVDAGSGSRSEARLLAPRAIMLRLTENAAYAAGLWYGALQARALGAVLPRLTWGRPSSRTPSNNRQDD